MPPLLADILALLRQYLTITISVLVALTAGGAGYGLRVYVGRLSEEQAVAQARLNEMFNAIASQKRLEAALATAKAGIEYLDARLAAETELAANLDRFYQLESATGVTLNSINQMTPAAPEAGSKPAYVALPFIVKITGSYPQVMQFMHEMEYGEIPARISTCTITRAGSGPASPTGVGSAMFTVDLTIDLLGRP